MDNEIFLTGYISEWDESLNKLHKSIDESEGNNLDVYVNSGGGSVFEGMAMAAYMKVCSKTINTHVIGVAASIASIISISGDSTSIHEGSLLMIHNASSGAWGESKELRKTADFLDQIDAMLTDYYVNTISSNGKLIDGDLEATRKQVKKWQSAETFFTAKEAVKHGFIQNYISGDATDPTASAPSVGLGILNQIGASTSIIDKYSNMSKNNKGWMKAAAEFFQKETEEKETDEAFDLANAFNKLQSSFDEQAKTNEALQAQIKALEARVEKKEANPITGGDGTPPAEVTDAQAMLDGISAKLGLNIQK